MAKILIVDDEESIRNSLRRFLQAKKHAVAEAGDGIEALDVLESESIDLAVVDLVMPRMNGLELISRMRKEHAAVPVVAVSAYPDVCQLDDLKVNVVGILRKPFELRHLSEALDSALGSASSG